MPGSECGLPRKDFLPQLLPVLPAPTLQEHCDAANLFPFSHCLKLASFLFTNDRIKLLHKKHGSLESIYSFGVVRLVWFLVFGFS